MPEFCTCGAQLPPEALFCHKCGKPQRELVEPDAVAPQPVVLVAQRPPTPAAPLPLDFRNRIAVRIALLVGAVATLVGFLPLLSWLAAGFFAVFFYRRRTGAPLNVGAGVRLGWMTGVMMFPMWAVVFTIQATSGKLVPVLEQQMKNWPSQDPALMQQTIQFLTSGPGLLFVLLFLFLTIIGLSIAGGALGAKMVGQ